MLMSENLKLIVEDLQDQIFESRVEESGKDLYITGCCAQSNVINANQRLYPRKVLAEAMKSYNEKYVTTNKALGELNHPPRPNVNPALASHRIVEMYMEGDKVFAKALVLNTSQGKELRGLIEGGWQVQASTRGLGLPKKIKGLNESQSYSEIVQYKMTVGFDVVQDQSAPDATMSGIYECHNGLYVPTENASNADWDKVFHSLKQHYHI